MDIDVNFDPAETYDEVSSILEDLELSGGWEILSHKLFDVTKQRKDNDESIIFSSETIIQRLPEEISEAILDPELRRQWDPYFSSCESLVQWGKNLQLIYTQQKYKWPLSDRDFILIQGISKDPEQKITIGWKSIEYDKKPRLSGFIRGNIQYSGYVITKVSDDSSHITFIEKSPPNGLIPTFLWNYMQKKDLETILLLKNFLMS